MIILGDAAKLPFEDKSIDLVFGSPPYMDARTYGIKADRDCAQWVDWMVDCTREAVRVSRGLVLWVVAGVTRDFSYWPGPEGLMFTWWKLGGRCWRPAYWHRVGIPGSGGKQWLRSDVEYILAFTDCPSSIPWADNTINGHIPRWGPGGEMSNRTAGGERVNKKVQGREKNGSRQRRIYEHKKVMRRSADGERANETYLAPAKANPGNVISIPVGGGLLDESAVVHENEAPFPIRLARWFIEGWCPIGGKVLDPFCGSGTTVKAAIQLGRQGIGLDIRPSQVMLSRRRIACVQPETLFHSK